MQVLVVALLLMPVCDGLSATQLFKPVGQFDFSQLLSINPTASSVPHMYFACTEAGLTVVRLGSSVRVIYSDLFGRYLSGYSPKEGALAASTAINGTVCLFGVDRLKKVAFAAEYDSKGQRTDLIEIAKSQFPRLVVNSRMVLVSTDRLLHIVRLDNNHRAEKGSISMHVPARPIFTALNGNKIALVDAGSGRIMIIDLIARIGTNVDVKSPLKLR